MLLAKRFKTHKGASQRLDMENCFAKEDRSPWRYRLAGFVDGVRNDDGAMWDTDAIKAGRTHWQLEKSKVRT